MVMNIRTFEIVAQNNWYYFGSSKNIFAKETAAGSDSNPATTMKMKGLLKGLRYISQIFDEEEEPELQIGGPTDVKHVAHIGWDGPTANAPSWIDNFKGEGDAPGGATAGGAGDVNNNGQDPTTETSSKRKSSKTKGSRRKGSVDASSVESPKKSSENEPTAVASDKKERSSRRKKSSKPSSSSSSKTSSRSKNASQPSAENSDNGKAPKA